MNAKFEFNEEAIQRLFGHEAAEDESLERLKEYYFKGKVYSRITSDVSLRILVAHKGIGKSALFKIAMSEDGDKGALPILIKPDDILNINTGASEFLQAIRNWKNGLNEIIAKKVLSSVGMENSELISKLASYGGKILSGLLETIKTEKININLDPAKEAIVSNLLKSKKIIVYIDDLDRGWEGKKADINRISALLNAIRDMSNENPKLYFRIALRSDVYFLVRTSDESTDKIEGSVVWYGWTNHEILVMLIKRIETFFERTIDEERLIATHQRNIAHYLNPIMEERFSGSGHWSNAPMYQVLMSLIRKRPRDLIKLCTLASRNAYECSSPKILTGNFEKIFEDYSQGRVQDTINEYRSELPQIEKLILGMKPNKVEKKASLGFTYTTDNLIKKLKNILEQGQIRYSDGREATPTELINFLFKINFLQARKELADGKIQRKYFEENRYLSGHTADFGYIWEVHPAYRWALQPDTIMDIYNRLELSADD